MTVQTILVFLQDDMNNTAEDAKIWRALNSSARRIARSYPWTWLRRQIAVTSTNDATAGFLMPADMIDVIEPLDDGNGIVFKKIDAGQVNNLPTNWSHYYYFDGGLIAPLASTYGVSINKNSTALSFTPALGATDYTGEYIRLMNTDGQDCGLHKMASNSALVSTYMGPRINGGSYIIRPSTSRRISFTDYSHARIAVSTTVNYWVYPQLLLDPAQEIPDIWEVPLRMLASLELTTITYDKRAENIRLSRIQQYEVELAKAQVDDGKAPMVDLPLDNTGQVRSMGWRNRNESYRLITTD